MTIYYFDNSPIIDKVRVTRSAGGRHTAYLHARETADSKSLETIKKLLTMNLMQWTPIRHDGEDVLEVRNIGKNGKKLLEFLADEGAVKEVPRKEVNPENKIGWLQKLKANTLRWSGFSYFIGDAGFTVYGWKDAFTKNEFGKNKLTNPQNLLAGLFYAMGTPFIAIFGSGDKSDVQLRHMSFDTLRHLEKNNIDVPENSSIRSVTHKHNSTLWKKFISKCERYPAEIANSFYGLAGSMIVWDGLKHVSKYRQERTANIPHSKSLAATILDIFLGALSMAAGLVSLFVEEETPNPEEPKKTGLARVWQWVKEKPLRTAGILLGTATTCHAVSTADNYRKYTKTIKDSSSSTEMIAQARKERKDLLGRAVFVVTNLAAEVLMSFSSKGHGKGVESDQSLKPSAYAVMADMILRMPDKNQQHALDMVASHLAKKENLNLPEHEIKQGITEKIEETKHNQWYASGFAKPSEKIKEDSPASKGQSSRPKTDWQQKMATGAVSPTVAPSF